MNSELKLNAIDLEVGDAIWVDEFDAWRIIEYIHIDISGRVTLVFEEKEPKDHITPHGNKKFLLM